MEKQTFKYPIGTWLQLAQPSCDYHFEEKQIIIDKQKYVSVVVIVRGLKFFAGQYCYKLYNPKEGRFYFVTESYIKKHFVRQLYIKEKTDEQRKLN